MRSSKYVLNVVVGVAFLFPSSRSFGEWNVCNHSNDTVYAAIALDTLVGYVSKGWYKIAPCGCATVYGQVPEYKGVFFSVHSHDGTLQWKGSTEFCVDPLHAFTLAGSVQLQPKACQGHGYRFEDFQMEVFKGKTFTTNLNAPPARTCHTY